MFVNDINPYILQIGSFGIKYYGVIFALGFILGYFIIKHLARKKQIDINADELDTYLIFLAVGTIIGARIFYCLIYNPLYYLAHPLELFFVWQGGLSFHGGMIGALLSGYYFCKRFKKNFLEMADITVVPLALGLALGRIGNFLNQELVGRITDVSWCVKFKYYDGCRHPSQLYASLKDFIIFGTLWWLSSKRLKKGSILGMFLIMYPVFRFIVEYFREPDQQLGYFFGLTMGQLISIVMLIVGLTYMFLLNRDVLFKQ